MGKILKCVCIEFFSTQWFLRRNSRFLWLLNYFYRPPVYRNRKHYIRIYIQERDYVRRISRLTLLWRILHSNWSSFKVVFYGRVNVRCGRLIYLGFANHFKALNKKRPFEVKKLFTPCVEQWCIVMYFVHPLYAAVDQYLTVIVYQHVPMSGLAGALHKRVSLPRAGIPKQQPKKNQ